MLVAEWYSFHGNSNPPNRANYGLVISVVLCVKERISSTICMRRYQSNVYIDIAQSIHITVQRVQLPWSLNMFLAIIHIVGSLKSEKSWVYEEYQILHVT